MFHSYCNNLSDSPNAVFVGPWALKEPTIPAEYVVQSVLSCSIEFWRDG